MVRVSIMGLAFLVLAGCGGGSGASGTAGRGGGAGAPGTGGSAGAHGTGGGTGAGGAGAKGGSGGGLPACAITTRPQDPVDTNTDGGLHDPRTHVCNTADPAGPWVVPEGFIWGDAGAVSDGGPPEAPLGGVVLDGDYDLVRILYPGPTFSKNPTRRTFRVFDGGTYIERAVLTQDPTVDGGMTEYWYDTTEAPSGTNFGSQSLCGAVASTDAYTADGDNLTLFVDLSSEQGSSPIGIDIYRRTCARP
jgi:hypothetical protein